MSVFHCVCFLLIFCSVVADGDDELEIINYTAGDNLIMHFVLDETPKYAEFFQVIKSNSKKKQKKSISRELPIGSKITAKTKLNKSDDNASIYIKFFRANGSELCLEKLPYQLKLRPRSDLSESSCLTEDGCEIKVHVKCNVNPYRYVLIEQENKSSIDTIISKQQVGSDAGYTCARTRNENSFFRQSQQYGNDADQVLNIDGNRKYSLAVRMTINSFDNNTNITCKAYDQNNNEISHSNVYKIITTPRATSDAEINDNSEILDFSKSEKIRFHPNQLNILNCDGPKYVYNIRWLQLRIPDGNTIKVLGSNKNTKNDVLSLSSEHIGSWLICMGYLNNITESSQKQIITRHLLRSVLVQSNNDTDVGKSYEPGESIVPGESYETGESVMPGESNEPESSVQAPIAALIGGGVVVGVIMLILIGYYFYRRRNRLVSNTHGVETYATAQVLYAQLANFSSDSTRVPQRDDCPYAQIIGVLEPRKS